MKEPLFSIVTVTKNNAAGLKLTGKSLAIQQQVPAFEWIVIDGASVDGTQAIVAGFAMDNLQFISEADDGLYYAMNKGLERAEGRYVWFLNGGDCLSDAFTLRDTAREIQAYLAPDFIYGDARENGKIKKARSLHLFAWGQVTHHQAMLYRRDKIGELRFDTDYKIAADYAFTLQMLARCSRPHYFARVLCDFANPGLSGEFAAVARGENYAIRRDVLGMPDVKNKMILQLNALAFSFRRKFPKLYWRLRGASRR